MYKVSKDWQDRLDQKEWPIPIAVVQTQTGNRIFAKETVPEITDILLNRNRAGYETENDKDSSWNFRYDDTEVIAQSFKLNITTTINTIELLLKRIGAPSGNLYIEMEIGPTEPDGTVRATSKTINVTAVNKEGFSWVSFPLNTELNIVKDEVNWIEIHGTYAQSESNYIQVGIDTTNGYANGNILNFSGNDIMFRAIGLPPLSFDDNISSFSQIRRILQPVSDTIIKGIAQRQLASAYISLFNKDRQITEQIVNEKWLGGNLSIYLYYKDLQEAIRIFTGEINDIQIGSRELLTIKAVEKALLTEKFIPRQASEFSNPNNEADYLPIVYGQTNSSPQAAVALAGRRPLSLIDKKTFRYLIADHRVNSTTPTIFVDGAEVQPGSANNFLDEDFDDSAALDDWTEASTGHPSNSVDQATFDGEETANFTNEGSGMAGLYKDLSSDIFEKEFTVEVKLYFDGNNDNETTSHRVFINPSSTFQFAFFIRGTDLFVRNENGYIPIVPDLVNYDAWQTWKFVVNHLDETLATCDMYLKDEGEDDFRLIQNGVSCNYTTTGLDVGRVLLQTEAVVAPHPKETYFDYFYLTGSPWAFNDVETFEGDSISSIVFVNDQAGREVSIFGGGWPHLGENPDPPEFVEDFLSTWVESDVEINPTSKAIAQDNFNDLYSIALAYPVYVIDNPKEVWSIIQDMLYSFLGTAYISPQDGRIHFLLEGMGPTKDDSLIISRNETELNSTEYSIRDIINSLTLQWPKIFMDDVSSNTLTLEEDEQSIRDYETRAFTFIANWTHDDGTNNSVGVRVVKDEIIDFLAEPKYKIKTFITDPLITLLEPGDHIYLSFDELIGTDGELLRNEWFKIIEVIYRPDNDKVHLVVLDTDQFLIDVGLFLTFPSDKKLTGYWKLDEVSGMVATDSSGNDNTGALINSEGDEWTPNGISGGAYAPDAADEEINCGSGVTLEPAAGDFSYTFWIIGPNFGSANHYPVRKITSPTGYVTNIQADGTILAHIDDGVDGVSSQSTTDVDDGNKHFIVVTVDHTTNELQSLYVDGELEDSDDITAVGDIDVAADFLIADNCNGLMINEVRFYKGRVLTPVEAKALFLYPSGENTDDRDLTIY